MQKRRNSSALAMELRLFSIKISLKFAPRGPNNKILALVQIMASHQPVNKPLSEPMMFCLMMHVCVTRPPWIKQSVHQTLAVKLGVDQSHDNPMLNTVELVRAEDININA